MLNNMCNWHEKKNVDANYNMVELMDLVLGRNIHIRLELNKEPIEGIDVDDQPTPIVKLPEAYECAHLRTILQWSILHNYKLEM